MIGGVDEITLAHIHAYADAQLSDSDCALVEEYFDAHPEKIEELQQFLAISEHYQAMFGSLHDDSISAGLPARLASGNGDLFASSSNRIRDLLNRLDYVLFEIRFDLRQLNGMHFLKHRLLLLLRLNHLEEKEWYVTLTSSVSRIWHGQRKTLTARFKTLSQKSRLHLLTAPDWLANIYKLLSLIKTRVLNAYAEANLFVIISVATIGILIGAYWQTGRDVWENGRRSGSGVGTESLAIQSHLLTSAEGQTVLPVEGEENQALLTWVSNRLGQTVRLIDLSDKGYKYTGVMLIPSATNYALVSVYKNDKMEKLTLFVGLREIEKATGLTCKTLHNAKDLCSWSTNRLKFVVISDSADRQTKQISRWIMNNYSTARFVSSHQ